MTPYRWQQIKEVFNAALEYDEHSRSEWLERTCDGDDDLRREVESLIGAHLGGPSFIDTPVMERVPKPTKPVAQPTWIGRTVGHYRIIEEIGRGGMSSVFRAARVEEHFEHQVAIKLLRQTHDTEQLLRRFRAERQILARLSHPNIAHLLDGGSTDEGVPYLVMEYVRGEPIDSHCERRKLDATARLRLFRTLCESVHYVHRHLMVHGDLKCVNVLVNEDGIVKLLDFGIAKLLDSAPAFSNAHHKLTSLLALTPEYASPEQIRGQPITTASDVYSLGVLLYRLLTQQLPYRCRSGAYFDLATQICETEPVRPSIAVATMPNAPCRPERLRGDLDNIILKALHKDPDQRYSSAEQFSQDIARYLGGFPVMAAAESAGYRIRRFVGRNRGVVITGSLVALSLVGGIVATSWQAHVANRERLRAERHFNDVRNLAQSFMLEVHDSITVLPGTTQARTRILENTLKYLDALAQEKADDVDLRLDLARAYERVGDLQDGFQAVDLHDTELALGSLRKARDIREALWTAGVQDDELLRDRFRVHSKLAQLSQSNRAMADAKRYSTIAAEIAQTLVRRPTATRGDHRFLGNAFVVKGTLLAMTDDFEGGIAQIGQGIALYEKNILEGDTSHDMRRSLAVAYSRTGGLLARRAGRHGEAYLMHLRALAVVDSLLAEDPLNVELRTIAAHDLMSAGESAAKMGDATEGLRLRQASLERFRALVVSEPENEAIRFGFAWALGDVAVSLHERGELAAAAQRLQEAQGVLGKLAGARAGRLNATQFMIAVTDLRLGELRMSQAARTQVTPVDRRELWLEARSLIARSAQVFRGAGKDALLGQEAVEYLAKADSALRECERALS